MVFKPCHSYIPTICFIFAFCFTARFHLCHLRKNIVKSWIQLHACAQDIYCLDQEVFENLDVEKASGPYAIPARMVKGTAILVLPLF